MKEPICQQARFHRFFCGRACFSLLGTPSRPWLNFSFSRPFQAVKKVPVIMPPHLSFCCRQCQLFKNKLHPPIPRGE